MKTLTVEPTIAERLSAFVNANPFEVAVAGVFVLGFICLDRDTRKALIGF